MHDCTTKFSTYPVDLLPLPGRMEDGAASPRGSFDPSKSLDDLAKGIQTLHEQVQNFASAIHSNEPSSPEKKDKSESGPDGLFRRGDRQQIGGAAGGAANGGGGGGGGGMDELEVALQVQLKVVEDRMVGRISGVQEILPECAQPIRPSPPTAHPRCLTGTRRFCSLSGVV